MKMTYDPRYNIAYVSFKTKTDEVETIRLSDELMVDISPDGTIYGIELLNANEMFRRDESGMLSFVNEATGKRTEVSLS
ncbi:MAG: DUF2283 domain-containing protein [Ignavibacteriae bacterium]|nr:DUF2283 domain-containing protein [Ignavibacteriota bacterium]